MSYSLSNQNFLAQDKIFVQDKLSDAYYCDEDYKITKVMKINSDEHRENLKLPDWQSALHFTYEMCLKKQTKKSTLKWHKLWNQH